MNKFFLFFLFLNLNLTAQVINNTLFAWGENSQAQLGDSTLENRNAPIKIGKRNNWRQISSGFMHTVAIKNDGSLWSWGNNQYGQLGIGSYGGPTGDGTPFYRIKPIRVGFDFSWKQVEAGGVFTIALKNDGSLWAWGQNSEGQLGIGTTTGNTPYGWTTPQQIGSSKDWKKISVGNQHVLALKNDGTLWAWGNNNFGQLGDGTGVNKLEPTQIGSDNDWKEIDAGFSNSLAIKNNGTLWTSGVYQSVGFNTFTQLGTDADWKTVSTGQFAWTAIKVDGSLWFLKFRPGIEGGGFNPQKETSSNNWSQISVGYWHAAAIKKDSTLWTWGRNVEGQLGNGTNNSLNDPNINTSLQVGTRKKWVQVSTGEMFTTATEYDCTPSAPPSVSNINYYKHEPTLPLNAVGSNLKWYTDPTNEIGNTTAFIPSNSVVGSTPYYVTQSIDNCESQAAEIKVGTLPCDGSKECLDRVALYVGFDFEIQGRTVGFFNRSKATTYSWDFGDNKTSTETSPTHEYADAGEYTIRLIASNANNQKDTAIQIVKVRGINKVTPDRGGTGSYVTVTVNGFGFDANTKIYLKSINTDTKIIPDSFIVKSINEAGAIFYIPANTELGKWNVVTSFNNITMYLDKKFIIENPIKPTFSVKISGTSAFRTGRRANFIVSVFNKSNIDAFQVPVLLKGFPLNEKLKLSIKNPIDYNLSPQLPNYQFLINILLDTNYQFLKNPIKYDTINNERYFIALIPVIPGNSTSNFTFEIFNDGEFNLSSFNVKAKVLPAIINSISSTNLLRFQARDADFNCYYSLGKCAFNTGSTIATSFVDDCAKTLSFAYSKTLHFSFLDKFIKHKPDEVIIKDASVDILLNTLGCATDIGSIFLPPAKFAKALARIGTVAQGVSLIKDEYDCLKDIKDDCLNKDSDGDTIPDYEDPCPNEQGSESSIVKGCLDSDGDKYPDYKDKCPTLPGKYSGCPDSDDDLIPDNEDICPNDKGFDINCGCPSKPSTGCDGGSETDKNDENSDDSGKSESSMNIRTGSSVDPNAKYVSGWGTEKISKSRNLAYTITFENLANAAFAAQKVVVKDTLDKTKLNVATFRFLGFGFNKSSFIVDEHRQFFQIIDLRPAIPAKLAVKGFLDEERGIVTWEYSTLDPTTLKETDDDLVGFLPPNTTSPQGEGFVSFSIDVMPNFRTGDEVKNKSSIIFDNNPAIVTNEVAAKIDEIAPISQMSLVGVAANRDSVSLNVNGSDVISGIESYDIFRSVNDSSYTFVETTKRNTLKYAVIRGKSYKFYSVATDNVGNRELPPSVADVSFTVENNPLCTKNDTTRLMTTTCNQNLAGVFTTRLQNRLSCDSIVIKTIIYTPASKPTITRSNDTLSSTFALTYQWYRNDTLLGGSINRILKTSIAGNYKVEITDANGCKALSDIFVVTNTPRFDCPILNKNIGDICDDSNPNTQNDKIQSNCTCAGTPVTNILTLNCPVNISVIAAIGQISVVVNYTTPTATSTCTIGNITVTPSSTNPASGTAFPIGTKTLSFTASDGCGNTKTCSFTITVVANSNPCAGDVTKPITKCKTTTVYLNQSGKATISGSDINNGSTDNCSTALNFAVSPNTFDCSKIGSNTVILTAMDAAGNKSTCSTIVNVSDNSAPVFSKCPANISLTTPNSCASATWTNPIVTDNCGTPSVSSNYNSGYCFSIGSKSVVYTATDAKGNKATCNFTVTVTAANTCTNVFSSNKCYKIVNKKSGKLLDVYGALKVNNTPIIQWNANNGANQKWRFISVGSGYVKIVAQNSGKEVACHRTTNNSLVYQYDYAPGGAKDWKIECVNNSGYYKITHRLSGKVLDVKNGSSTDGQYIVISNFNANNNSQLWQIVEVTCPTQTYNLASSTIFDINGQAEFDRNRIGFTTNQGFRTDFFTVEKQEKVSGLFEPLEILNNKQVDNNAQYNTVYDNSPYEGDNFYRVKMTYLSGDFEYSAIQKIVNTQKEDFIIFPNPASNEAWIDLKSFEGRTIDITISDVAGKIIWYEKVATATTIPHRLDLSNVQNGSYTLTIQTSGKRTIVRKLSILK